MRSEKWDMGNMKYEVLVRKNFMHIKKDPNCYIGAPRRKVKLYLQRSLAYLHLLCHERHELDTVQHLVCHCHGFRVEGHERATLLPAHHENNFHRHFYLSVRENPPRTATHQLYPIKAIKICAFPTFLFKNRSWSFPKSSEPLIE